MSETNNVNPEELVEIVTYEVDENAPVPTPIDPTLTHSGEAADAKATGDAIRAMIGKLLINGKAPVSNALVLYATDILMSGSQGALTIAAAIEAAADKDASEIIYTGSTTIKAALDAINTALETDLTETEITEIFESVFGGGD